MTEPRLNFLRRFTYTAAIGANSDTVNSQYFTDWNGKEIWIKRFNLTCATGYFFDECQSACLKCTAACSTCSSAGCGACFISPVIDDNTTLLSNSSLYMNDTANYTYNDTDNSTINDTFSIFDNTTAANLTNATATNFTNTTGTNVTNTTPNFTQNITVNGAMNPVINQTNVTTQNTAPPSIIIDNTSIVLPPKNQ